MNEIQLFLNHASEVLYSDDRILAVCAAGSWITHEIDMYSDLDLVLVTNENISASKDEMIKIASRLGSLTAGFTGEHVGENRLLICLYENPLLHVDLKFVQIDDYDIRVENPVIIWEKNNVVTSIYEKTIAKWPVPDYQWIEDRFWVWIHYAATKLGRGELFETIDFLSFLRTNVLGPLLHMKYNSLPRGVRKIEFIVNGKDLTRLTKTLPAYSHESIKASLFEIIALYKELRKLLYDHTVIRSDKAEKQSLSYLKNHCPPEPAQV